MRKESLLVVLVGVVVGFGISSAIYLWQKGKLSQLQLQFRRQTPPPVATPTQPPTPTPALFLRIISPENESVFSQERVRIEGETKPGATVVIVWEEGEDILVADSQGKFSSEITLVGGENEVEITAWDEEGNSASRVLTLIYSTAKF